MALKNSAAEIQVHPSGKFVYASNRGHDSIVIYAVDEATGKLTLVGHQPTEGKTPRNFGIDPTGQFLLAENQGSDNVVVFRIDAESGKFLYASNRGHDSIVIYAVDGDSGTLEAVGWEPVQGRKPRFFCLDPAGERLYAANENSHTIVEFLVDAGKGTLTPTGQVIETGSPACIVFSTR